MNYIKTKIDPVMPNFSKKYINKKDDQKQLCHGEENFFTSPTLVFIIKVNLFNSILLKIFIVCLDQIALD